MLFVLLILLTLFASCTRNEDSSQQSLPSRGRHQSKDVRPPESTEPSDEKWTLHKDQGFQVKVPEGYEVKTEKNGVIHFEGSDQIQARIWPFFIPGQKQTKDQFILQLIQNLASALYPDASLQPAEQVSNSIARVSGKQSMTRMVSILSLSPSDRGISGVMYVSAAPEKIYESVQGTFAHIFESFQLIGAPFDSKKQTEPEIQWIRFQDPREQAFSVEVPSGWKTDGGLFRVSAIDIRPALQSTSPDGQIRISAGDTNIPIFSEPTQQGIALGFPEGSWYTPGPGATMLVRRYFTGQAFLMEYLPNTFAQQCNGIQIAQSRSRPDLVQNINAVYAQYNTGMTFTLDAGEATFQCQGGNVVGYYLAATKRT